MQLFSLEGQVAFVTGAGSGIGQAIAVGLAGAARMWPALTYRAAPASPAPSNASRPWAVAPWP